MCVCVCLCVCVCVCVFVCVCVCVSRERDREESRLYIDANLVDRDIVARVFDLQSRYCFQFKTGILAHYANHLVPPTFGLIVKLLFFNKKDHGFK